MVLQDDSEYQLSWLENFTNAHMMPSELFLVFFFQGFENNTITLTKKHYKVFVTSTYAPRDLGFQTDVWNSMKNYKNKYLSRFQCSFISIPVQLGLRLSHCQLIMLINVKLMQFCCYFHRKKCALCGMALKGRKWTAIFWSQWTLNKCTPLTVPHDKHSFFTLLVSRCSDASVTFKLLKCAEANSRPFLLWISVKINKLMC